MSHFVHVLNLIWPYVVAALVAATTGWFGFKIGRKWRREYREALANRKEYHALKAAAQLQAAQGVNVHVEASPVVSVGSRVQSRVREPRREVPELHDRGAFCAFCGRFGCGATCREAIESGRAYEPVFRQLDEQHLPADNRLVHRAIASPNWNGARDRHGVRREWAHAVELEGEANEPDDGEL